MRINADFSLRALVRPGDGAYVPSPTPGVERLMLDRIGEEIARATTIVRYAPNSSFPAHEHGGGEEFLVLQGLFLDEHGAYPAGTYVRNPIGTRHSPSAGPEGALLFVKLHQFSHEDVEQKVIDTGKAAFEPGPTAGTSRFMLHEHDRERVTLVRWTAESRLPAEEVTGGAEILVVEGGFEDEQGTYPTGSWLRLPHASRFVPRAGPNGALLYVKTGHLPSGG